MEYDAILQHLGDFGPFQRRTALLLVLGAIQTGQHIAVMTFVGAIPDHHCRVAETGLSAYNTTWPEALNFSIPMEEVDGTWKLSSCRKYSREVISGNFTSAGCPKDSQHGSMTTVGCTSGWDFRNRSTTGCTEGWEYDRSQYHSSVVMQHDLVCERAWLRELAQSVFFAGVAIGGLVFGVLSDRFSYSCPALQVQLFMPYLTGAAVHGRCPTLQMQLAVHVLPFRCGRHPTLLVCALLLVTCGTGLAFTSNLARCGSSWEPHSADCSTLHWSQVRTERTAVHYTGHRYAQNELQYTTLVTVRTDRTSVHYTGHGTHRTDCSSLHWSQVRTERTAVHYTGHRYAQNELQYTTLVTGMETIGISWRMAFGICTALAPAVGYALLGTLAYVIRDWRILQLAITSLGVLSLIAWWFIPESPRWLLLNNKVEQWREAIQRIAEYNGVEMSPKIYKYVESSTAGSGGNDEVDGIPGDSTRNYNILDLVRTPNMRKITVAMIIASLNTICVYVGLLFGTSLLAGSHYVNFILGACVEAVAILTVGVTMRRWGRKRSVVAFSLLAGVSCVATAVVPNGLGQVTTALATVGRFGVSSTITVLDIYSTELFPTVIRHMGVGTTILVSRVGGIVAPFLSLLGNVWRPLPLMTLGVLSCVTSMVVTVLPETHGVPLPNTLEDGENFGRASPLSSTCKSNYAAIPKKTFAAGRTVYEERAQCELVELLVTTV
ncbi:SLC22A3 [Branchiostoma lanceolatum]|uniref:SLC22A3 protein n=1 Tax=Branchiostoma lanceolatum TaxID=7740 RepID=A0A8J9ZSM9_BRALA|nr:SLC22A3 [Branchiostoma lanceolatum]